MLKGGEPVMKVRRERIVRGSERGGGSWTAVISHCGRSIREACSQFRIKPCVIKHHTVYQNWYIGSGPGMGKIRSWA
eukprot:1782263-Rhodomonas_salina.1